MDSVRRAFLLAAGLALAAGAFAGEGGGKKYNSEEYEAEPDNDLPVPKLPAFPGAAGYGARSLGARAGGKLKVVKVTTLKPDGPGSLQAACSGSEPRVVVFEVSGVITPTKASKGKKYLAVGSNCYIAGQTAPGAGISIEGMISTRRGGGGCNQIIRFMRARPTFKSYGNLRAFELSDTNRVILDHCTGSWSTDDCFDLYSTKDATVQWCTDEESDIQLEGGDEPHNFGMIFGYGHRSKTVHHTLIANHHHRAPLIGTYPTDFRNNVLYNIGTGMHYIIKKKKVVDGFAMNLVGCYSRPGPATIIGTRIYLPPHTACMSSIHPGNVGSYYVDGNYIEGGGGYVRPWKGSPKGKNRKTVDKPFKFPPVETHLAEEAYRLVLAHAGCLPRDSVSLRTVREVKTRTGYWGRREPDAGLMEGLTPGKPPADSDKDGMPDAWEKTHKLDPNDSKDAAKAVPAGASPGDRHKDYTYIEYYVNDLADRKIAAALTAARFAPAPATPWDKPATKLAPGAIRHKSLDAIVAAIRAQTSQKGREDTREGFYAVQQLTRMGEKAAPAVPELVKLLKGNDARTVSFAAWALGAIGPAAKAASPDLARTIERTDLKTQKGQWGFSWTGFSCWALGNIGPEAKAAIPTLVKAMNGRDVRARVTAAWALSKMGPAAAGAKDALLSALGKGRYGRLSRHAAEALAAAGAPAVDGLAKALSGRGARDAARALMLMGPKGKGAAGALAGAVKSSDPAVRAAAARALGKVDPSAGSAAALAAALSDKEFNVRNAAAQALGDCGPAGSDALSALKQALKDERREVRRNAALAMGAIGKAAVSALAEELGRSADPTARKYLARAIGDAGADAGGAADALVKALSDKDAEVRREAVWSLGLIGPGAKAAAGALKEAHKDADQVVRYAAPEALKRINK